MSVPNKLSLPDKIPDKHKHGINTSSPFGHKGSEAEQRNGEKCVLFRWTYNWGLSPEPLLPTFQIAHVITFLITTLHPN